MTLFTYENVDENLYSRQIAVVGTDGMVMLRQAKVLLIGLNGVGAEIGKNLVLSGVQELTLLDESISQPDDLCSQFFLSSSDVDNGIKRADACCKRLAELNEQVSVQISPITQKDVTKEFIQSFNCVILANAELETSFRINDWCRSASPSIPFIFVNVHGLFGGTFSDFGDHFHIEDVTGQNLKDAQIESIERDAQDGAFIVCTVNRVSHGFADGDSVRFSEVRGISQLNGKVAVIEVLNRFSFKFRYDGIACGVYEVGGIAHQMRRQQDGTHNGLRDSLMSDTCPRLLMTDFRNPSHDITAYVGLCALLDFQRNAHRLPKAWCKGDADEMVKIARAVNERIDSSDLGPIDFELIRKLALTAAGCFSPLCSILGGVASQEALKGITKKTVPLNQWMFLNFGCLANFLDMNNLMNSHESPQLPKHINCAPLRICLSDAVVEKLTRLRLFVVGCGAIGCELLKNMALLRVATCPEAGKVTVTDNDVIEKSNLNRQFLFRSRHINQFKSKVAAESIASICDRMNVEALQLKATPETEETFSDKFFESMDCVLNALDNVEARIYTDKRCIQNRRRLIDSGTSGLNGHVQVIVPRVTETYGNQRDEDEADAIPFCTLRSFPTKIEHSIEWARNKFHAMFYEKPALFNKFWINNKLDDALVDKLQRGVTIEGLHAATNVLKKRPRNWEGCVVLARVKFEKYFNHKAQQLLRDFPADYRNAEGVLFWLPPRRQPAPIQFSESNPLHMEFIWATAKLMARVNGISCSDADTGSADVQFVRQAVVPKFRPNNRPVALTDEEAKELAKQRIEEARNCDPRSFVPLIQSARAQGDQAKPNLELILFDKDDSTHVDFIVATTNLRSEMYGMEAGERHRIKQIAGRIIPAIATTTAIVAGLVAAELVKMVADVPIAQMNNAFLSLGIPSFLLTEVGPVVKRKINSDLYVTAWDRWEVFGHADFTLKNLIDLIQSKYKLVVELLSHGKKAIFMNYNMLHFKRLPKAMIELVPRPVPDARYVDLTLSASLPPTENEALTTAVSSVTADLDEPAADEDIECPILRYYYDQQN